VLALCFYILAIGRNEWLDEYNLDVQGPIANRANCHRSISCLGEWPIPLFIPSITDSSRQSFRMLFSLLLLHTSLSYLKSSLLACPSGTISLDGSFSPTSPSIYILDAFLTMFPLISAQPLHHHVIFTHISSLLRLTTLAHLHPWDTSQWLTCISPQQSPTVLLEPHKPLLPPVEIISYPEGDMVTTVKTEGFK